MTQAAAGSGRSSIVDGRGAGRRHEFGADDLPVTLGSGGTPTSCSRACPAASRSAASRTCSSCSRPGRAQSARRRRAVEGHARAARRRRHRVRSRAARVPRRGGRARDPHRLDRHGRRHGAARSRRARAQARPRRTMSRSRRSRSSRAASKAAGATRPEPRDDGRRDGVRGACRRRVVRVHGEVRGARHRAAAGQRQSAEHAVQASRSATVSCCARARIASPRSCRATTRSIPRSRSGGSRDQTIALALTKLPGHRDADDGARGRRASAARRSGARHDAARRHRAHAGGAPARVHGASVTFPPRASSTSRRRRAPGARRDADARLGRRVVQHGSGRGDGARRRRGSRRDAGRRRDHDAASTTSKCGLPATTPGASKILVEANRPQQLPEVRLTQADGRLEIASKPSEANVSVDGEFRGRTPLSLRLSRGARIAWR